MKHSLISNIFYVYKFSFKKFPRIKLYLIVNFITELLVPLSTIAITTILVYTLTHQTNVEMYLMIILLATVITFFLEVLRFWSSTRLSAENTYTRITSFWNRIAEHQLKTDYVNVESKDRRGVISKAFEAIASNHFGVELMLQQAPKILVYIVGMIIYGVLIATYVPVVLLILLVMTIFNFLLTKRANLYLREISGDMNDNYREKYYLTKDSTNPNYGKDIRVYKIGDWFSKLFVQLTKSRVDQTVGLEKKFLFANLSNTVFLFIRDLTGYIVLLGLVVNGDIDLTTFTFLIGIVTGFSLWLNGFTTSANNLRGSNVRVNDFRLCLEIDDTKNQTITAQSVNMTTPITIEFDNVTFTYPEAPTPVIDKLSFYIEAGEKIALVGSNGAGKTTIIKLLCGLYKPDSGVIRINGHDINEFDVNDYMKLLSVVFQDSEPLSFSLENIITCQEPKDVDKEKMWDAVEKAGLKDKILSLTNKEKTFITQIFDENGIRLSGGETQKLMLARSLYKNAPVLILDEPTASLDPLAEAEMYIKYKNLVKGNTSIFISHRLSSTKFCDRILFLEDGKIVEEGSHDKLIELNNKYREVFDIQAKYYREDVEHA